MPNFIFPHTGGLQSGASDETGANSLLLSTARSELLIIVTQSDKQNSCHKAIERRGRSNVSSCASENGTYCEL